MLLCPKLSSDTLCKGVREYLDRAPLNDYVVVQSEQSNFEKNHPFLAHKSIGRKIQIEATTASVSQKENVSPGPLRYVGARQATTFLLRHITNMTRQRHYETRTRITKSSIRPWPCRACSARFLNVEAQKWGIDFAFSLVKFSRAKHLVGV